MCAPYLPLWSWSRANHLTASQWTGLMHLISPAGSDAWQRRTASLPAVTISLPFFLLQYHSFFLQSCCLTFALSLFLTGVCLLWNQHQHSLKKKLNNLARENKRVLVWWGNEGEMATFQQTYKPVSTTTLLLLSAKVYTFLLFPFFSLCCLE